MSSDKLRLALQAIAVVGVSLTAWHGGSELCAGAPCPPTPDDVSSIDVEGFLKKTGSGACTVDPGAFVKYGIYYQGDVLMSASGFCQWYNGSLPGPCDPAFQERRGISNVKLFEVGSSTYLTMFPIPQTPSPFTMDSRSSGTTSPDYFIYAFQAEGNRVLRWNGIANPTACAIYPNIQPFDLQVRVVSCMPRFLTTQGGNQVSLSSGTVYVYIDPGLNPAATAAMLAAMAQWNAALDAYGVGGPRFQQAQNPCAGPFCITVEQGSLNLSTHCAKGDLTTSPSGTILSATLTFPPESATWNSGFNQRTAAHELGHLLGLSENNTSCSTQKSLMRPVNCNASSGYPTAPTISDHLPIATTVYGTGSKVMCPSS